MTDLAREVAVEVLDWKPMANAYWLDTKYLVDEKNWHPDTDIADAWLVVERMRELGWCFDIDDWTSRTGEGDWSVIIERRSGDEHHWRIGEGPSLPRALCVAALAAIRAGEKA